MAELSKARETALKILVEVEQQGAYLNICLRDTLYNQALDPRDKSLVTELCMGVTKNKLYIDNIIKNLSSIKLKKLSVWIHNILRIGIYSIKFLDRIPVSATVNECVKLSKRYGHVASSRFVNAILRKSAQCGDFLPDEKFEKDYLSVKYSFPLWMVDFFIGQGYNSNLLDSLNSSADICVRLNDPDVLLDTSKFKKHPVAPMCYSYIGGGNIEALDEYKNGTISVQDASSQYAVSALDIQKDGKVLDLCAAPGGKSTYAAIMASESGSVISCDIHTHKLELIKNNACRIGLKNINVMENDATKLNETFIESFDYVICDVPCSGLGIIRRKPDIKWTKNKEDLSSLVNIQRQIIDNASKYVKKGGRLLYSTCTINKHENEENVNYFLNNHCDYSVVDKIYPSGRQLLPYIDNTDGFFVAVFERM